VTAEGCLAVVAELAQELGLARVAREAQQALAGLAASRFNVVFLGQFKRGKSTLVNALVGQELLPTDVLPSTGVITVIAFAEHPEARVTFGNGQERPVPMEQLPEYVTEEENPENRKGVAKVTVGFPCPLTRAGANLVDTPGLGSVFHHSAAATKRFLPRVDVGVVVLGADPPLTQEELGLLAEAKKLASHLVLVLNKADRVSPEAMARACEFTARMVPQEGKASVEGPYPLSAWQALHGGDPGVSRLLERLLELARTARSDLAEASALRAGASLGEEVRAFCQLQLAALREPAETLAAKLAAFREAIADVDDLAVAALARARSAFRLDVAKVEALVAGQRQKTWRSVLKQVLATAREGRLRGKLDHRLKALMAPLVQQGLAELRGSLQREAEETFLRFREEVGQVVNRLLARVSERGRELFGANLAAFQLPTLTFPEDQLPFEPALSTLALEWSLPRTLAVAAAPRRLRGRLVAARAKVLFADWWRQGSGALLEEFAGLVDRATREGEAAVRQRLATLEAEILQTLEQAEKLRQQSESSQAQAIAHLEQALQRLQAGLPSPRP